MNAKFYIYTGTLIGVLAFAVELLGHTNVARLLFITGFSLAFAGIVATTFLSKSKGVLKSKKALFYQFSIIGFAMATLGVLIGGQYGEYLWPNFLFRIGSGIFFICALISMYFSRKNN